MLMRLHSFVWWSHRDVLCTRFAYLAWWISTSLCCKLSRPSISSTSGSHIEAGSGDVTTGQEEEEQQQSFPSPCLRV